ncbi:MAG TPA: hypothetical protein PLG23_12685 [Thermoflexales bacterium]|jgi:hypothetical protein|nr:hypothetical protein [Thermoflexales bacterium]HQV27820.1 hypothetical protein [Thermoflexales bacterium]HQZ54317.1 hypothetical protein [Thermoflexales bacterium]HRA54461.1 hypothetical protein [Thermoflexales bacterium]
MMVKTKMLLAGIGSDAAQFYTILEARLGEHAINVPFMLRATCEPGLLARLNATFRIGDELDVTLDESEPGAAPRMRLLSVG